MNAYYDKNGIKIYNADNLEVLRNLPDESINLIYCDILYNTGKVFSDYNDNLGSPKEAVKWYRPRFAEMKRVLAANGSIFIHCNWRLDSYIRILMDEIFGEANFRNRIYRKHSGVRGFYKNFDSQVDIILYYVKDASNFTFNMTYDEENCSVIPLFEEGIFEERGYVYDIQGNHIDLTAQNKHWILSKAELDRMVKEEEIVLVQGLPYRYTSIRPIGNLWCEDEMLDKYDRTTNAEVYDTPKPEAILQRIIRTCSNEGDTVADFFMGGGTTAVVAKAFKRKGIFCDINPKACEVAKTKLETC